MKTSLHNHFPTNLWTDFYAVPVCCLKLEGGTLLSKTKMHLIKKGFFPRRFYNCKHNDITAFPHSIYILAQFLTMLLLKSEVD